MKWKRKLARIHVLKKKEQMSIARSQELANRHKAAVVNYIAMQREIGLMSTPTDKLPYWEDKLARRRQMLRRKK